MDKKIYTKTGDKGTTTLFTGERISKDEQNIEALGTVDEGNSAIGLAISLMPINAYLKSIREQLETIQHALFDLGAALATPRTSKESNKIEKTRFDDEAIIVLEQWIDQIEKEIPPLKHFILPGGHPSGAALHLARSIVRRAERSVIALYENEKITQSVLIYLNRLSDYLFMVSRYVNHFLEVPETQWEKHKLN